VFIPLTFLRENARRSSFVCTEKHVSDTSTAGRQQPWRSRHSLPQDASTAGEQQPWRSRHSLPQDSSYTQPVYHLLGI